MTYENEYRTLVEFVEEFATEKELTAENGVRAILDKIEKDLKVLKIFRKYLFFDYWNEGNYSIALKNDPEHIVDYTVIRVKEKEFELLKQWIREELK